MRALLRDAQDQTRIALEVEEVVYDPKDNKLFLYTTSETCYAVSKVVRANADSIIEELVMKGYDRYFKKALADTGAASQVFSAKSIRTLGNLYLDHEDEFEKLRKHCGSRIEYPAAKILDMCFFEYGYQRDASSQEDSD